MPARKSTSRRITRKSDARPRQLVVYIHGIGAHPAPELVKREWDLALFGREMGDQTRLAYWSDILHAGDSTRRARSVGNDRALSVDELLESAGVSAKNEKAQALAHSLMRTMGVESPGGRAKALPLPSFLRKPIARAFLEGLVKDTAAYFFRAGMREKIQKRLRDLLPPRNDDVTLVAHSHGTIVAMEVLAALARDGNVSVSQLVTIGSPLGIQEVQDFLNCPLVVPKNVHAWNNFADPLDPVALDKGIGNDFDPAGFIQDELVLNTRSRSLDGFNPHSAAGYLAHPKVRDVVHRSARVDMHARFLVARDVASDLAIEARQPVLIEILEPGYPAVDETPDDTRAREAIEAKETTGAAPASGSEGPVTLERRIDLAARKIEELVGKENRKDARIDRLRRYVAARLTPSEVSLVAHRHRELRVYAVWKSTRKRKLLRRSIKVIQADAAHASYSALGTGIRWAVLDTGVRSDHPHFHSLPGGTVHEVWDCTEPGRPRRVRNDGDYDGHGTHVSGIIAGQSPDGSVRGIAPRATLTVYRVLDRTGGGEDAWIIKALDHIAEQNENSSELVIHGINLSLGGPYDASVYGCGFSPLCQELRRQWRSGVLVCVSSGNEGQTEVATPDGEVELNTSMSIGDPANLEDCIAVGSVNADKPHLYGVSSFSSRGPTSDGRVKPDVVAPGERISSCNSRYRDTSNAQLYRAESGTSMAAPHVSGLLAAFLSVRREFRGRPDEVKEILLRTCTDLKRDRYHQGHGLPNLMKMLLEA